MSETRETPPTRHQDDDTFELFHRSGCDSRYVTIAGDSQKCNCGLDVALAAVDARHAEEIAAEVAKRVKLADNHAKERQASNDELRALREQLAAVQQFKERVARALCVENEDGPVSDDAIVEAADATLSQLLELSSPSTQEPQIDPTEWFPPLKLSPESPNEGAK
jgi:hypothetical protein